MHTSSDSTSLARFTWLVFALIVTALGACSESSRAKPTCEPQCAGKSGGADGCGGTCPAPKASSECERCGEGSLCLDGKCICQPTCDGTRAGSDGCGGSCACREGTVPNAVGECVTPGRCTDTCKTAGAECGDVCGTACGTCGGSKACVQSKCLCVPKCDGTRCDDGCGGTCACAAGSACAADGQCVAPADCHDSCSSASRRCGSICGAACGQCGDDEGCFAGQCKTLLTCADCDLQLHVLSAGGGKMKVALDFAPQPGAPHPRLADIRVRASKAFQVTKVQPGEALGAAGKELFVDAKTGAPFHVRADGSIQMLVHSIATVEDLGAGRVATFELTYAGAEPVSLWLVRRDDTFAPPPADNALQSAPYDTPVTVSR